MIGVVAASADIAVVCEFFELFKTPWEVYESGRPYDVVLCAGHVELPHNAARFVVVYRGQKALYDCAATVNRLTDRESGRMLSYRTGEYSPVWRVRQLSR